VSPGEAKVLEELPKKSGFSENMEFGSEKFTQTPGFSPMRPSPIDNKDVAVG
jgi:hypothetical protein